MRHEKGIVPPHDIDAEKSVLGSCLIDRNAFAKARAVLTSDASVFYSAMHQWMWDQMSDLHASGVAIDMITVGSRARQCESPERLQAYVVELTEAVPTAANVEHYAKIVRSRFQLRRVMEVCLQTVDAVQTCDDSGITDLINGVVRELQDVNAGRDSERSARHIGDLVQDILSDKPRDNGFRLRVSARSEGGGFKSADDIVFSRQRPGYVVTVCGRPGEGKTTFLELIGRRIAEFTTVDVGGIDVPGVVALWSGECPQDVQAERLLAMESLVPSDVLRNRGPLFRESRPRIEIAASRLERLPIWILNETMAPTLEAIEAALLAIVQEEKRPISFLGLDRFELIKGFPGMDLNSEGHRKAIAIKSLSMRLKCVTALLCQPNEDRKRDGRAKSDPPKLSDLQYGSALRQISQAIVFLHRDDYELQTGESPTGVSRLWVLKNNDGPQGAVPLLFKQEFPTFFSSEHEYLARSNEILRSARQHNEEPTYIENDWGDVV